MNLLFNGVNHLFREHHYLKISPLKIGADQISTDKVRATGIIPNGLGYRDIYLNKII